jgi:hypothetical protein
VKVVSEKIRTSVASMTIVDAEETAFGPFLCVRELFMFWPHNVQDDGHSILVVVPKKLEFKITSKFLHSYWPRRRQ